MSQKTAIYLKNSLIFFSISEKRVLGFDQCAAETYGNSYPQFQTNPPMTLSQRMHLQTKIQPETLFQKIEMMGLFASSALQTRVNGMGSQAVGWMGIMNNSRVSSK